MQIRLSCGKILTVPDGCLNLSEVLLSMNRVETMDQLSHGVDKASLKRIAKKLTDILPQLAEDLDAEEARARILEAADAAESPKEADAFRDVHARFHEIFLSTTHRLPSVSDEAMQKVVEFLCIPCADSARHPKMFEDLPLIIQNNKKNRSLAKLLRPELHGYIPFMNSVVDDLSAVAEAATYLQIYPLIHIVACQFGRILLNKPEREVRETFKVPVKFRSAVVAEHQRMLKEHDWTALLDTNDTKTKKRKKSAQ
jgi:hypothetical protein